MIKKTSLLITLISFAMPMFLIASGGDDINKKEVTNDALKIKEDGRLINLFYNHSELGITLYDTQLIEDDAPALGVPKKYFGIEYRKATAPWQEDLKKGIVIKKILMLDNSSAWNGRLLFFGEEMQGNKEPIHISINGYHIIRNASEIACPAARQYIDFQWLRWYFVDLPIGALNEGENEVLMWTESDLPTWKICVGINESYSIGSLIRTSPNRSMKSIDGGKTWSDSKLGLNNTEDGEYNIRFSLDRYVPKGEYISPVIDIVNDSGILKKSISSLESEFYLDIERPENTNVTAMMRFGSSPLLADPSWTEWDEVDIGDEFSEDLETKRYFQWKVELTTDNLLVSPVIKGIKISSEWEDESPNNETGLMAEVIHNGKVKFPSYLFTYENLANPKLKNFREKYKLDEIVEGAESEFEIMMRLLHWSYRVPVTVNPYSWNADDLAVYKEGNDGMPQLQWDYEKRRRDAQCSISNLVLQGALMSMGYQARYININSEAISGHEITEVWSNEFNKWIYIDATRDYYYFDIDTGLPMNLLEVHNKLMEIIPRVETWQRPFTQELQKEKLNQIKIGMRQGNNPASVKPDAYHALEWMGYFRIPLRNDFYSNSAPLPVAQGYTMWGWDGYLNHYDSKFPKRTEFQRQSDRAIDFYAPINQSQIFLSETDKQGIVKVEVDTYTPGFDIFLVRINDGEWIERKNAAWNWKLLAGVNKLEIKTRTLQGIHGPVSCIGVVYNP